MSAVTEHSVTEHRVSVPGGSIYHTRRGRGPVLLLMAGGPGHAGTLAPLADQLAGNSTVVCYDRRGYSRSQAADPAGPAGLERHAADARLLIAALGLEIGSGPVSVFGTSFGALIALELAATVPAVINRLVVHEPPLGQMLAGDERQPFDLNLDQRDPVAALNAIAATVGARRGLASGAAPHSAPHQGPAPADVELFIRRDAPAIGRYHLDLSRLRPLAGRLVLAGSEASRDFYPYQCTLRLARELGTPLIELPGDHAGMIQHPAEFAARLLGLLRPPACGGAGNATTSEEVTK